MKQTRGYTKKMSRGQQRKRLLVSFCLLFFSLLFLGSQAYANDAFKIVLTDEPNSNIEPCLKELFPEATISYCLQEEALNIHYEPSLILMPEHQAYPLLEQGIGAAFQPLYRASLLIGRKGGESTSVDTAFGYKDLTAEFLSDKTVASLVPPRYLTAALKERLGDGPHRGILKNMQKPYREGRLVFYNTDVLGPYQELPDDFWDGKLPDLILAYDYQLVQINEHLKELGSTTTYAVEVPSDGSLFIDFGLFATNRAAASMLNLRIGPEAPSTAQKLLLARGFRLPDGSQEAKAYLPDPESYFNVSRIKNYYTFNEEEMTDLADFQRCVNGLSFLTPASVAEELITYFILTVIFVAWMITLFYRLDEPDTRFPLSLYLGSLAVWIFARMIELLLPTRIRTQTAFSFLPMFCLTFAWLFLAWRRIQSQKREKLWMKLSLFIASLGVFILALAALTNEHHHLLLQRQAGDEHLLTLGLSVTQSVHAGPLLYFLFGWLLLSFILGYVLLLLAREQSCSKLCTVAPLIIILLCFAYNGYYLFSANLLTQRAFTRNSALFAGLLLELMLRLKFLPANTKYFRFFRYNPLGMRLVSDDLVDIYTPDHLQDLTREEKRRLQREIQRLYPKEKALTSRFDFKKKVQQAKQVSEQIHKVPQPHDPDHPLAIKEIRGGFLLWQENVKDLRRLRERLSDLSELLEQQQHILKQEQNVRTHLTTARIRRELLVSLEQQLSEKMAEIQSLIKTVETGEKDKDPEILKAQLGRLKMLVSQAKRKSNLLVRAEPDLSLDELRLIFKEALKDAESSGITGLVIVQGEGRMEMNKALFFYDYLQELLQKNADLKRLSVFLMLEKSRDQILLQLVLNGGDQLTEERLDIRDKLGDRQKALGVVTSLEREDQDLRLRLSLKEENDA